ncbi:hypothetical protein DER45DRAFT_570127 [Fusarium avenaceum]|nr:hypothetical protein DER45DRAFT_570127 [Fusarium avenaceum]
MSRRAGIRYSESSEDEDYEHSRSNNGRRGYYFPDKDEQARHDRAKLARPHEVMRPNVTATSPVQRPRSTTPIRPDPRTLRFYSAESESERDDEVFEANGRTSVLGNDIRLERNYVGGHNRRRLLIDPEKALELERDFRRLDENNYVDWHNRPGHSTASKLQRQGPRALSDVCNKDTISRDNTVGNQAQMDELLASFGKKVFGMHCHELREQPHTEPVYSCKYCLKTFNTRKEESRHRIYLWPSDPSRGRCKTWEEYYDEKNSNSKRRQRQQLAQDEYGDETEADLREIGPPTIPKEYSDKTNAALHYIQASRHRARQYAKAKRDLESDDDSSESGDGAEYEELSDYVY